MHSLGHVRGRGQHTPKPAALNSFLVIHETSLRGPSIDPDIQALISVQSCIRPRTCCSHVVGPTPAEAKAREHATKFAHESAALAWEKTAVPDVNKSSRERSASVKNNLLVQSSGGPVRLPVRECRECVKAALMPDRPAGGLGLLNEGPNR